MPKVQPPELKKFMDKRLSLVLNANRRVTGTLRGFDQFMNVVLDQCRDATRPDEGDPAADLGMVVVRGASIVTIEVLDPIA